jgi:hypothetical protein
VFAEFREFSAGGNGDSILIFCRACVHHPAQNLASQLLEREIWPARLPRHCVRPATRSMKLSLAFSHLRCGEHGRWLGEWEHLL